MDQKGPLQAKMLTKTPEIREKQAPLFMNFGKFQKAPVQRAPLNFTRISLEYLIVTRMSQEFH